MTWWNEICDFSGFQISIQLVGLECLDFWDDSRLRITEIKYATRIEICVSFLWNGNTTWWNEIYNLLGFQISIAIVNLEYLEFWHE